MPFREHGPYEHNLPIQPALPNPNPFGQQMPVNNPQLEADESEVWWDQKLHRDAERKAAQEQYDSPIMKNEREQRRSDRKARRAAPKPGEFNLVPPGRNVFPASPVPPPPGPAQ
tara:strand:+ start:951 stop:1292 length:342 start_codon:yes stop_codon:yes gene_type:complete